MNCITNELPSKKLRILQAALEVFSEQGYHPSTIDQIAERAGVGKGTVYLYFESKQGLFTAILQEGFSLLLRGAADLAASEADARLRLARLVHWHLQVIRANMPRVRVFIEHGLPTELNSLFPELERRMSEYQQLYVAALREGIASGYWRPHHPELVAAAIMGMLNQVGKYLTEKTADAEQQQLADEALLLIFKGIEKVGS